MHQPEDDEKGNSTNEYKEDKTRGKHAKKVASKNRDTFGGMKKGFLVFGAGKTGKATSRKKRDIHEVISKTMSPMTTEYEDDIVYPEHQILGPGLETEESAKAAGECNKNPGHETFIPIDKLTKEDLPERYQDDEELMELIKVTADLTVRLRVYATSRKRAELNLYTPEKGGARTGTGFVHRNVGKHRNPCQCSSCQTKPMDQRICWTLEIHTAQHVVMDDEESKTTRVDFFYDSEESRTDGRMKTYKGGEVILSYTDSDGCVLQLTTCDQELVAKVIKLQAREKVLWTILKERYGSSESNLFVWIVSHPHGLPKLVTFGEIKDEQLDMDRRCYNFSYSVDTCQGSSGASVFRLGTVEKELKNSWFNFVTMPNYAVDKGQFLGCGQEYEDSFKAALKCVKNPGHKAFIPICKLTKEDLPKYFQDDKELLQFIKVTAGMTVRVRVCDTNPISPREDNPETGGGYTLTYTGLISGFSTEEGPCQCNKCKDKEEKSQTFWEFHVPLYGIDLGEECDTKTYEVDLFYDSEESCTDGRMKTFGCENVDSRVLKRLNHRLKFTTCETEIVTSLVELYLQREWVAKTLIQRYKGHISHNLVWKVSHPHGLAKHITVGKFLEKKSEHLRDAYNIWLDLASCPGCSGACELDLSYRTLINGPKSYVYHSRRGEKCGWNVGYCAF